MIRTTLFCVLPLAVAGAPAAAQTETITATAAIRNADGTGVSTPVTIVVQRYATDAQRDALLAAVKTGGTGAAQTLLAAQADAGTLQLGGGGRSFPIKYAYARSIGEGRLLTVITAEPIALTAQGAARQQQAGRTVGLALLEMSGAAPGQGELAPAATVRVNDQGAIVTETGATETVRLTNVVKK